MKIQASSRQVSSRWSSREPVAAERAASPVRFVKPAAGLSRAARPAVEAREDRGFGSLGTLFLGPLIGTSIGSQIGTFKEVQGQDDIQPAETGYGSQSGMRFEKANPNEVRQQQGRVVLDQDSSEDIAIRQVAIRRMPRYLT